jgi:hypothetical protein
VVFHLEYWAGGQQFFTIRIFPSYDILHKYSEFNWIHLAQNKNQWLAPANMVKKTSGSQKAGNLLTRYEAVEYTAL